MNNKFIPSLNPQKVTKENFDFLINNLPYKSELIDGKIYFDNGEIAVEDALIALMYYVGMKKIAKILPKERIKEFIEYYNDNKET